MILQLFRQTNANLLRRVNPIVRNYISQVKIRSRKNSVSVGENRFGPFEKSEHKF